MSEKLKIISLGGLNEIGKNLTVLEYGRDIIIVDCGMGFPEDDMFGIDSVIADTSYLVKNKDKIRGMFITHGHEDHIGSIPYCMQQVNCPIHGTAMTCGLIKLKLEEHKLADGALTETVLPLLLAPAKRKSMSERITAFACPDANQRIYESLMGLIKS